jgi:hypothetical protein
MGEAKRKRDRDIIPVAEFTTPNGCIAVNTDGYLHFVIPPNGPEMDAEVRHQTKRGVEGMMIRTHGIAALQDMGHTVACEMIETLNVIKHKTDADDVDKQVRMQVEAEMFAVALQEIERHPFIHIIHNSKELTTGIEPMRKIKTDEEFQAWHRKIVSDRYGAEAEAGSQMHPLWSSAA